MTAPGEDSSNIIHADVLMVEPPDGFGIARVKSEVARSTKRPRKDDHTASPTLTGDKVRALYFFKHPVAVLVHNRLEEVLVTG